MAARPADLVAVSCGLGPAGAIRLWRSTFGDMINSIRSFFSDKIQPPDSASEAVEQRLVQRAAAALLLELAYADDEFTDEERGYIEQALARQFALDEEEVAQLIELAHREQQESVDHFQFTTLISEHFDLSQKVVLAEVMWGLVSSDGHIAAHEAYLVRKISNLLQLEPGYLNEARKRAIGSEPGKQ